MSEGWFKVHRCLFEKAIWQQSTPEQKVILITLLGMANHKGREWEWQGKQFKAEPGEFVTSVNSIILRAGTGITRQNVRTALRKVRISNHAINQDRIAYKDRELGGLPRSRVTN